MVFCACLHNALLRVRHRPAREGTSFEGCDSERRQRRTRVAVVTKSTPGYPCPPSHTSTAGTSIAHPSHIHRTSVRISNANPPHIHRTPIAHPGSWICAE